MIRTILFRLYFYMVTAFISIVFFPFTINSNRFLPKISYLWAVWSLFGLRYIGNVKINFEGIENIPKENVLVASKHQSAIETILYWKVFKYPIYVLKQELLKLPFYGRYLKMLGMVSIDRQAGAKALKSMLVESKKALDKDLNVVIFPEGTRVPIGEERAYNSGIAAIYSTSKCRVLPVALDTGKFWAPKKFKITSGECTVKFLPVIEPGMDRDEFLKLLQSQIETESNKLLEK